MTDRGCNEEDVARNVRYLHSTRYHWIRKFGREFDADDRRAEAKRGMRSCSERKQERGGQTRKFHGNRAGVRGMSTAADNEGADRSELAAPFETRRRRAAFRPAGRIS